MRSWPHSGFSVDQSVFLGAGDRAAIERLVQYMTRCPFSLSRLVRVTDAGQVIYKAEKQACRAFPDPRGDGLRPGRSGISRSSRRWSSWPSSRNTFRPAAHLIRYYGWYSNKARGVRRKLAAAAAAAQPATASRPQRNRSSQTWAMLIKRVYEVDPLACPKCGGLMKVVAFIEPPQGEVIERILRHCGLWCPSAPRAPPATDGSSDAAEASRDDPRERTYVDIDTFEATF